MGIVASFMKRVSALFGWRRKNNRTADGGRSPPKRGDALDNILEVYLADDMIDIPLVPEFIERRVYRTVLEASLDALRGRLVAGTCAPQIFGHTVRFEMSPAVEQMVGSVEEAHALVNRDEKQRAEHRRVVDEFVQRFVDNENIACIGILPDALERRVYANVIKMAMGIVQDVLHTSKVGFLGHEMQFRLVPRPESLREVKTDAQVQDERAIADFVDEKLRRSNIALLPDAIERRIYIMAFRLLLAVLAEVLRSCEISVLNHSIRLRLDGPADC